MSELDAAAGYRREHNCQTPDCPNDFAVITVDLDTGESTFLCHSCQLAFWLAILQKMADEGTLILADTAGEAVDAQPTPG